MGDAFGPRCQPMASTRCAVFAGWHRYRKEREMTAELTFPMLRAANMSRCARWHPRGLNEWTLSDWACATGGELGEAMNIVKKLNRERDGIAGNTLTEEELRCELADELADVAIYLDIWAASEGIDLGEAIASKFNRTSEKVGFPERLEAVDGLFVEFGDEEVA
jgi:NTP pyrophosphatase (non-canonical NTP hydrolase)